MELAGQIAELARRTLPGAFRTIDPAECRLETRLLLSHALGLTREQMILRRNPRGSSPAIEGMAAMLREAFRPVGMQTS